jgi:hypothetical protein
MTFSSPTPATGKGLGRGGGSTTMINTNTDRADPMLPGAVMPGPKASVPSRNPDGIVPAASFSVDLVIFDDGTTWGPGTAPGSQKMLENVQLWLTNHKPQE